jgi:hypothetical protein
MRPLPQFQTVTEDEMRAIWRRHRDDDVHRLCLEVARYRRVIDEIEGYRVAVDRAWHDAVGGSLVGLYQLRLLLKAERERIGVLSQFDVPIGKDDEPSESAPA